MGTISDLTGGRKGGQKSGRGKSSEPREDGCPSNPELLGKKRAEKGRSLRQKGTKKNKKTSSGKCIVQEEKKQRRQACDDVWGGPACAATIRVSKRDLSRGSCARARNKSAKGSVCSVVKREQFVGKRNQSRPTP